MKEIILLIEVPSLNYTNGIAESNLRLFKKIRTFSRVYFFEDKPFHNMRFYFFSKILSLFSFLKNYFLFLLNRFKKSFKDADFLYIVVSFNSDFGILKNFLQIILLHPFSKKLIIHIHRSDISYNEKSDFIKYLQKFVLSCSYKIIVLSNELSNNLPLKNFKDKTFVLQNTLDPKLENILINLEITMPQKISSTKFFFYSNILISKGVGIYLDLFNVNKSLNKRFSTIAGYPNKKSLVNFINENNHKFLGYISREMKSKLFLDNDCIIFTSPNEGSPLILLEAMASGVFILSSNVGFIPELLGKKYPFMCKPNVNDFSKLIYKYFSLSEDERYKIIFNQRKRYLNLFAHKNWSEKVNLIFE